jgi:hypothetical protein
LAPRCCRRDAAPLAGGHRNDGLARLAGSLRRKGATQEQLEAQLLEANLRRCRPPLDDVEVCKRSRRQ